ncbi:MAG: zf-HC2 domain-containing protein [Syntrophobacteraceae bacterium]
MDCSLVTELLSEYVDDVLDPSIKAHVEEHLAHCRTCTDELVCIRTYLHAMESLPGVPAPVDFLESLQERLEQPGLFKRLLTRLFYPMKLKIPFEVAGVVAASLLVVLLYRGVEPEKAQFSSSPPAPATSDMSAREAEKPKKDETPSVSTESPSGPEQTVLTEKLMKAVPPLASRQEAAKTPAEGHLSTKPPERYSDVSQKPVELVLRLAPSADQPTPQEKVMREQAPEGASFSAAAPQTRDKALAGKAAPAPMSAERKAEQTTQPNPATTLSRIKDLAERAGGSILSVDYEKETQLPQVVSAQLPAAKYPSFLNELRSLGRLEEPDVGGDYRNKDALIRLRIQLVPPM